MTSINDTSYPIYSLPPMGLDPQPGDILPKTKPYWPQPQVPVKEPMQKRFYIDTRQPNPFTIKPIATQWHTNELLMNDPQMRVVARVSMADIGEKQASNYVSPQHLNPGWKWCGGYQGCERSNQPMASC